MAQDMSDKRPATPGSDEASPQLSSAGEEAPKAKLTSAAFVLTLASLALCVFCVALDTSIITTAVPRITDDFSSTKDIGW